MPAPVVKIENWKQINRALAKLPRTQEGQVARAIWRSGLEVERDAVKSSRTPVDTGDMRDSIAMWTFTRTRAEIYPTVNYSIYVHEGTRYMQGRPFMKWAWETASSSIENIFAAELTTGYEKTNREAM